MAETRDPRSVILIDAAEQAALAGDYALAEQLLREAALLLETSLGPLHPDLANTLNNLGIACEMTDKPVDAEHCFRRAFAIATAVLEPDHPFVVTSRRNLEDFCTARGRPVDELQRERRSYKESRPVVARRWSRPVAIGALIVGALFLTFIATATWFRSYDQVELPPESPSVSPGSAATPAASPTVGPSAPDAPKETGTSLLTAAPESRATTASVPQPPLVASAQLCKELSTGGPRGSSGDWHCVAPSVPVGPGSLFFYTRLKSRTVTTVQHRWYRGNRLHQVVELTIRANTTGGYRTYSRNTVDNQGAGDWRVELRTRDGVLLHKERFVVR